MVSKHSYLLKDDFIFCILAEDKESYYGEILYGMKKCPKVNSVYINSTIYSKYWELESNKGYQEYISDVKNLYPKYYVEHELFGKCFRVEKSLENRILYPIKIERAPSKIKKIASEIESYLGLRENDFVIGGKLMLGNIDFNDLDIIIKSKKNIKKVHKRINRITSNRKFQILKKGKPHRRRFRLENIDICPFGIDKEDNFFEKARSKKVSIHENIVAKVTDSSLSLLSPAVYNTKVMDKDYYLISYFVGHCHLFKEGEFIRFNAPLFEFKKSFITKKAFVIPMQGSWIEILN